jgi:hypothetical protein
MNINSLLKECCIGDINKSEIMKITKQNKLAVLTMIRNIILCLVKL